MSIEGLNPFDVVRVPYDCDRKNARTAALKLIRELHPDKGGKDDDYLKQVIKAQTIFANEEYFNCFINCHLSERHLSESWTAYKSLLNEQYVPGSDPEKQDQPKTSSTDEWNSQKRSDGHTDSSFRGYNFSGRQRKDNYFKEDYSYNFGNESKKPKYDNCSWDNFFQRRRSSRNQEQNYQRREREKNQELLREQIRRRATESQKFRERNYHENSKSQNEFKNKFNSTEHNRYYSESRNCTEESLEYNNQSFSWDFPDHKPEAYHRKRNRRNRINSSSDEDKNNLNQTTRQEDLGGGIDFTKDVNKGNQNFRKNFRRTRTNYQQGKSSYSNSFFTNAKGSSQTQNRKTHQQYGFFKTSATLNSNQNFADSYYSPSSPDFGAVDDSEDFLKNVDEHDYSKSSAKFKDNTKTFHAENSTYYCNEKEAHFDTGESHLKAEVSHEDKLEDEEMSYDDERVSLKEDRVSHNADGEFHQEERESHQEERKSQKEEKEFRREKSESLQKDGETRQKEQQFNQAYGQSYQDKPQLCQEEGRSSQKKGKSHKEKRQSHQEKGQSHQEKTRSHQEKTKSHQEKTKSHQEKTQSHQEELHSHQEGQSYQEELHSHQEELHSHQEGQSHQEEVQSHKEKGQSHKEEGQSHKEEGQSHKEEGQYRQEEGEIYKNNSGCRIRRIKRKPDQQLQAEKRRSKVPIVPTVSRNNNGSNDLSEAGSPTKRVKKIKTNFSAAIEGEASNVQGNFNINSDNLNRHEEGYNKTSMSPTAKQDPVNIGQNENNLPEPTKAKSRSNKLTSNFDGFHKREKLSLDLPLPAFERKNSERFDPIFLKFMGNNFSDK